MGPTRSVAVLEDVAIAAPAVDPFLQLTDSRSEAQSPLVGSLNPRLFTSDPISLASGFTV